MNKKFIKVAFVAAIALVGGVNVFNAQKTDVLSGIALANVEALADEEIGTGKWIVTVYSPVRWQCTPNGGASCPGTPW